LFIRIKKIFGIKSDLEALLLWKEGCKGQPSPPTSLTKFAFPAFYFLLLIFLFKNVLPRKKMFAATLPKNEEPPPSHSTEETCIVRKTDFWHPLSAVRVKQQKNRHPFLTVT
jgi:hypothetical protein